MTTDSTHEEKRKLVHVARMAVRWRDMDLNRHVNNVEYFRYLEQARIEWFDLAVNTWRESGYGIVIANAHLNFLKALTYPAIIEVCVYVGPPGRTSFTFHYEIRGEGEQAPKYADGYTRVVWVDRRSGRPAPLPDALRSLLA